MTADISPPVHGTPEDPGAPSWAKVWNGQEMESHLANGICEEVTTQEKIGIHPYWLRDVETGAMEELRKELGKLSKHHEGYLLGFKRPILLPSLGKQSSHPHPYIYFKFRITRYIYKPSEGQVLKGLISRLGQNAASCVVFGTFMATVYPETEAELQTWQIDDQIEFTVQSFDKLRKGVSLRGKSTGNLISSASPKKLQNRKRKFSDTDLNDTVVEDTINTETMLDETAETELVPEVNSSIVEESPKKKKKRKKHRSVSEDAVELDLKPIIDEDIVASSVVAEEPPKKKRKKNKL